MDSSFYKSVNSKPSRSWRPSQLLASRAGRIAVGVLALAAVTAGVWAAVHFGGKSTAPTVAKFDAPVGVLTLTGESPAAPTAAAPAAPAAPAAAPARPAAPAVAPKAATPVAHPAAAPEPVSQLTVAALPVTVASAPPPAPAVIPSAPAPAPAPSSPPAAPTAAPGVRLAAAPAGPATPAAPAAKDGPSPADAEMAREGHVPPHAPRPDQVTAAQQKDLIDKLADAQAVLAKKDLLAARWKFNALVDKGLPADANAKAIAALEQIAKDTLFSQDPIPGDPAADIYRVPPGGVFVLIGRSHKVQARLLMSINGVDEKHLQAGQMIKVVNGPFNAVVDKTDFTLTVYLDIKEGEGQPAQPVFIRRFKVGLGQYNSTPTGVWRVDAMELNPPYKHPRTGKRMTFDDPEYPLGKPGRWVQLKGLSGAAVGQVGYGIHGTNQPDSIGKLESLGCVRLQDKDMAVVWDLLTVSDSKVVIRD